MLTLTVSLGGCGLASEAVPSLNPRTGLVVPRDGFSTRESDAASGWWWMVEPQGEVEVWARPSGSADAVSIRLTLRPTPCGPARVTMGGRTYDVDRPTQVELTVDVDAEGRGSFPVSAPSPECRPAGDKRTLRVGVFDPEIVR